MIKIKGRQQEYNQVIENICMKMNEPGFESEVLKPDISIKIQRFQNANCLDQEPEEIESPMEKKARQMRENSFRKKKRTVMV